MLTRLVAHYKRVHDAGASRYLEKLCSRLLSEAGSANTAAIASEIIAAYAELPDRSRSAFFQFLDSALRPDARRVMEAATAYATNSGAEQVLALQRVTEPPRQELLRRINAAPGATAAIIGMRRDLLKLLREHPELRAVDSDFRHLLGSWFNPGFLTLQQVDWNAPAALLEKIIHHEAVHEIKNWSDLRRRLQPDRRCFAFFHPQLPGEPLIFVEVALVRAVPRSIHQLISEHAVVDSTREARVAAFYSISNCEPGLAGVSLGNFLIKRVAEQLRSELPTLKRFCTLSPIPKLRSWMRNESSECEALNALREKHGQDLNGLAIGVTERNLSNEDRLRLEQCAAMFLKHAGAGGHDDPVARFHLHNGARLERINIDADLSPKGLRDSFGIMVNYLYDLHELEANHEHFVMGQVPRSRLIDRICQASVR